MHRKPALILTMLALVIGSLSQAQAALASAHDSAASAALARAPAAIAGHGAARNAPAAIKVTAARDHTANRARGRTQGEQRVQSGTRTPKAPPGTIEPGQAASWLTAPPRRPIVGLRPERPVLLLKAPAGPANLTGTIATSPASVSLTWTNHATTPAATQVWIQRATNAGFTSNVTDIPVGAAAASYTDTTVVAGTTYYYRVLAQNLASNSPWSNVVSILYTPLPAAPSALAATLAGSSVSLTWTNHATTPAATQVWIQRATNAGFTSNVTNIPVGAAAASYTDTTVVAGTTYYYRVLAQNLASNSPWSNVVSILYTPLPAAPSALAATLAGSSVSLTWTNHATTPAATQVWIQRATNAGFTSNVTSILVGAAAASYTDTNVVAGTTYYYRVLAQGLAGNSPWSNVASIMYALLPTAPSGLAATLAGSSVSLTWTNNATTPAATQVWIQRATDAGFTSNVTSILVGAAATSYTDTSVVAGTTYYYRVLAQGLAGNSPWSNVVSFLHPSAAPPASFFGSQFACSPSCAGSFGWSEDTSVITADSVPAGAPFTNMLRVNLPAGQHRFRIRGHARDAAGRRSGSDPVQHWRDVCHDHSPVLRTPAARLRAKPGWQAAWPLRW